MCCEGEPRFPIHDLIARQAIGGSQPRFAVVHRIKTFGQTGVFNVRFGQVCGALAACLCVFVGSASAQIPLNPTLMAAHEAKENNQWDEALAQVARAQNPRATTLFEWHRLRGGEAEFGEYVRFLSKHDDWPGLRRLRRVGEGEIPADADPIAVVAYFESEAPQTANGALRLATAYRSLGREAEARSVMISTWRNLSITEETRQEILQSWSAVLQGQHWARVDTAIWQRRLTEAERMLPLLDRDYRRLAEARIALRRRASGVDAKIAAIPAALKGDPGLAHDRFEWRYRSSLSSSAIELMLDRSTSAQSLGRPEAWGERRRILARRMMRNGDYQTSYRLAANHFMTEGYAPADMEWLAGFVRLRKLRDPAGALPHFQSFLTFVETPISLARGHYWAGRTYEAMGNQSQASASYAQAAQFQTTYYGQLAAERVGAVVDRGIIGSNGNVDWRNTSFMASPLLPYADLAHQSGDWISTELFLTRISLDLSNPLEIEALAQYAMDQYGRADTAVRLSKQAALDGYIFPNTAYPITALAGYQGGVAPELVKALARQESELNPEAESHAGALGLMQVMPRTAAQVAREIGLPFSEARLTEDWRYNAQIGTHYLEGLLDEFNGSIVLSAAGYNAGPHRARQWIERYGDPRRMTPDQVVDWIEGIPFRETRNYVQRVVEGLHVYRMRLTGEAMPLRISADLTRGLG